MCAIARRELGKPIRTFAIGMDVDAIDLKYARQVAEYIGSDHTEVIITKEDVLEALPTVVELLATYDITTIRASVGMYLVCKYIHEHTDVRVLLTGEVSDELFGYKYTDFAPDAAAFQREAEKRVRELHMYDVLRADRCISVNSLEARVPFGDLAFVRCAMAIDPALKMNRHGMGKYLLRKAFAAGQTPAGEHPLAAEGGLFGRRGPLAGGRSESAARRRPIPTRRRRKSAPAMPTPALSRRRACSTGSCSSASIPARAAWWRISGCPTVLGPAATWTIPPRACSGTTGQAACNARFVNDRDHQTMIFSGSVNTWILDISL